MNPILRATWRSGRPWKRRGRLLLVLLALGLVACDRSDLTSGSFLKNDEGVEPEPPPPGLPEGVELKVNEIMVENTSTLEDESGNFPPWIEIYNLSDLEVNLAGVFLSDSFAEPEKWAIPDIAEAVVGPFGFLVVFADGDEDNPDDLHASFTLTRGQATRVLINGGAEDLVQADTRDLAADATMGRFPDGGGGRNLVLLEEPTPGAANAPPGGGPPPVQEAEFIRGDVTEDGSVTVSDMVGIQLILAGERPLPECEDRADANDDGIVDDFDPPAVGNAVFRGSPLPPPYPTPGMDPTEDDLTCRAQ